MKFNTELFFNILVQKSLGIIELYMHNILDPASIGSIFNPILYLTVSKVKMNVPIVVLKRVQLEICVFYPEPKDHVWICYQSGKISCYIPKIFFYANLNIKSYFTFKNFNFKNYITLRNRP